MVVFTCGLRVMALNLEESNVDVVVFGDDRDILEGGRQALVLSSIFPSVMSFSDVLLTVLDNQSMEVLPLMAASALVLRSRFPESFHDNPSPNLCLPGSRLSMPLSPSEEDNVSLSLVILKQQTNESNKTTTNRNNGL